MPGSRAFEEPALRVSAPGPMAGSCNVPPARVARRLPPHVGSPLLPGALAPAPEGEVKAKKVEPLYVVVEGSLKTGITVISGPYGFERARNVAAGHEAEIIPLTRPKRPKLP